MVSIVLGVTIEDPKTGWIEGVAILFAVVLVLNVTAYNNIQQNQQFIELKKDCEAKDVDVKRDGKKITISSEDIIVGDLVFVETGDKIMADGFYVEGQGFKVSEASMTGETNL